MGSQGREAAVCITGSESQVPPASCSALLCNPVFPAAAKVVLLSGGWVGSSAGGALVKPACIAASGGAAVVSLFSWLGALLVKVQMFRKSFFEVFSKSLHLAARC